MTEASAENVFHERELVQLARAACEGDVAEIKRAVLNGADVNGRGNEQVTPLVWALKCRNLNGVTALLASGADPNQRVLDGRSPVWLAATFDDSSFLKALAANGGSLSGQREDRNTSALLGAISAGFEHDYWDNYYFVLASGIDINVRYGPEPGISAAEKAAALARFDKVLELIERGYDKNLDRLEMITKGRVIDEASDQAKLKEQLLDKLDQRK